jgi:hypothetical protein
MPPSQNPCEVPHHQWTIRDPYCSLSAQKEQRVLGIFPPDSAHGGKARVKVWKSLLQLGMVAHICNPSTQQAEVGKWQLGGQ